MKCESIFELVSPILLERFTDADSVILMADAVGAHIAERMSELSDLVFGLSGRNDAPDLWADACDVIESHMGWWRLCSSCRQVLPITDAAGNRNVLGTFVPPVGAIDPTTT